MNNPAESFPIICKTNLLTRLIIFIYNAFSLMLVVFSLQASWFGFTLFIALFLAWTNFEFFLIYNPHLYIFRDYIQIHLPGKTIEFEWKDIKQVKEYTFVRKRALISLEKSFFPGNLAGILHNRFQPTIILERTTHTNYNSALQVLKAKVGSRYFAM